MTEPCDKGPLIEMLIDGNKETHKKLDRLHEVLSAVAVQKERVDTHEGKFVDLERRIRKIEGFPLKVLVWLGGILGALVIAWATYSLNLKG